MPINLQESGMNLKNRKAEEAYINVSKSAKKNFLLAFQYLLVDQKRFLDRALSLESIASELKVSKGHLSRIINSNLNISFNDYVNLLRVNEAKNLLLGLDSFAEGIFMVGFKSGFNSKSTFYSSFKKLTGCTPLQYINNDTNESEMMI